MKKTIEGYFVRDCGDALFSTMPFDDNGYFDESEWWNHNFETDGMLNQLDNLDGIFQLCQDIPDNTPHRCKITIELEPCDYKSCRSEALQRSIESHVRGLATLLGCSAKELLADVKSLANAGAGQRQ